MTNMVHELLQVEASWDAQDDMLNVNLTIYADRHLAHRCVALTPDEARTLADLLTTAADKVDAMAASEDFQ